MREIDLNLVRINVRDACLRANKKLPDDITELIDKYRECESCDIARRILNLMKENSECALENDLPVCQDTGMVVIFARIGQDVHFVNGDFREAVNSGVSDAYVGGYMRCSVVADPLDRVNTNNNTPCVIYSEIVPGDRVSFLVTPKGFGSENMSKIKMFTPSATTEDILDFIVDCVKTAGSNPCPPVVVGVGIGGTFDYCAVLAKKALCRGKDCVADGLIYQNLEIEALKRINSLNIGPQGFGGDTTALKVNIEHSATHIAGLPVAVNMGCYVTRHAEFEI
ncbi:MAG: fumarate hydratase [Clostridiales bacterium]|nr:fumarate hydratase [Clostridiales bacterium]